MFNGKTHYKWPFSIAMLVYQRVIEGTIFVGINIHKSSTNSIFLSQLTICWCEPNQSPPGFEKNSHVESLKLNGVNNPLALIFDTFQSKPWFLVLSRLVLDPFILGPFSRVIMICMYVTVCIYIIIYNYLWQYIYTHYIYTYIYTHYIYIHTYILSSPHHNLPSASFGGNPIKSEYIILLYICIYCPILRRLKLSNLPIFIVQQHVCWWTPPWTLQPPNDLWA